MTRRNRLRSLAAIAAFLICTIAGSALAQVNALPQARHILVYGEAQAQAIPDRFRVKMTFATTNKNADPARQAVEQHLQSAISGLRAAGVDDNEIVATTLQIEPQNEYDDKLKKHVYVGTEVKRDVSARFADQASLKRFLSGMSTSQEVQISDVTAELSSEPELRAQLRQKAIESTRGKADVIAKAYGVRLTGLYSVSDTAPDFSYGIKEGNWPTTYRWNRSRGNAGMLDKIEVTGSRIDRSELFQTGYVDFTDKIYAVFLIDDGTTQATN